MAESPIIRANVVFHGHVQGVFFRKTTQEFATRRGLRGWVRNVADGTVELEAQGPAVAVNGLLDDLSGHFAGHIEQVERSEATPREDAERGFHVRY